MREIYKAIESMPPLSKTVTQIQSATLENNLSVEKLAHIVSHDPMLSASLLKMANSPIYGLSRTVNSISHAIALLGVKTLSAMVVMYGVKKSFDVDLSIYGITKEKLSDVGLMQSRLAMHWAKKINPSLVSDLSMVCLLSDLGILVIAKYLENRVTQEFQNASNFSELIELEKKLCGHSSYEVSAMMFQHWNFDENIISSIECLGFGLKDVPNHLTQICAITFVVKHCVNIKQQYTFDSINKAASLATHFGLPYFEEAVREIGI